MALSASANAATVDHQHHRHAVPRQDRPGVIMSPAPYDAYAGPYGAYAEPRPRVSSTTNRILWWILPTKTGAVQLIRRRALRLSEIIMRKRSGSTVAR